MISKRLYIQICIRVIFIAITALAIAFSISKAYNLTLTIVLILLFIGQIIFLIQFLNATNRKIAYFFKAIKNEDFTLRFPEISSDTKSLEELNSSLNGLNGMLQNVHSKNQAQEKYYQEILKHADIGLLTINKNGHILFANQRVEKLLNYSPLNHIKQLAKVDTKLFEIFKDIKPFERKVFEMTNEREKITLSIKSTSVTLDGKELLLVVIQDIHKELDEKETASWSKLIRVLTHEIMNTITPITSISDTILRNYTKELSEEAKIQRENTNIKGLEVIKNQGKNLMEFVQSYRSLLNVPKPDRKLVSAKKLVDNTILLAEQYNQSNISITSTIHPENLELFLDEQLISQVLINLTKNAIQAIGNKENGNIRIEAGVNENTKFISITDNGKGIPEEVIQEIFVPFFTTKETGTGIGLSLSRQILQLHDGNLKVTSKVDEGTCFVLSF